MKLNSLVKYYAAETLLKSSFKLPSRLNIAPKTLRFGLTQFSKVLPKPSGVQIRKLNIAGIAAEEIRASKQNTQLILHIHGGAFFLGGLDTHRHFMAEIAKATQMQVIHIDYPLAPEHPFPTALNAAYDVYHNLLDQGILAKDIILSGDSCGANLALSLALKIKQEQAELQPSGLILLSPLLDLTLSSESLRYNRKHDALLSIEVLEKGIDYYLPAQHDRANPMVSPLYAELEGLNPVLIQVGSKEILLDDAKRFEAKAKQADVDVHYKLYTGMWHNFQMFSPWFDEAKQALQDIAAFSQKLDQT